MKRKIKFDPTVADDANYLNQLAFESDSDLSEANDSCDDETDYVEEQLEVSDSDLEEGDEEMDYQVADQELEEMGNGNNNLHVGNTVYGRDKTTKWLCTLPNPNVRTRSHNIVTHLPRVKGLAKKAKSALECWQLFFDKTMLELIVENINKYIANKKEAYTRERDCNITSSAEIKAFIGLLYLAGYYRNSRLNTEDLWANDGSAIETFRLTMSRNRFHFLLQTIRFDDKETRNERKALDKLAPVRTLFEMFVQHCQNNYSVSEYVTIDEMLPAFRGKCPFRQYIPSKPSKYGIKVISMVDSKMFYTANLEVYLGAQPDGPYKVDNSASSVVKRLCSPIRGTGRNISAEWFTSYELVSDLLKDYKLTYVGTVRKNKRQLPPNFLAVRGREKFTSEFVFQNNLTLVSYIPRKGKNVILMSSMHHYAAIDPTTADKKKPEIITFYNATKSEVDVVDKLCGTYSTSRNTNRWPMVLFYMILDVAAINAHVIYKGNIGLVPQ